MLTPWTARLAAGADGSLSDAELVARFVAHRDEAAFAALVRRHGPTVFGVCRKTLRHTADAEDAFQATFLVLVRKAGRVAFRRDIASWLVAVAVRASREVLRQRSRRESRETSEPFDAAAPETSDSGEACAVLLAEVAKLPPAYRAAVTLCELAGVSRADAAKRLGIPEGTLSSRLAAARRKLAVRLTARGLAATLPVLALPVPSALAARVLDFPSTPSTAVTHLTEAMMRTTIPLRALTLAAVAVLAVVGLGFGDEPAKPKVEAKSVAVTKKDEKALNRIFFHRAGGLYSLAPDGTDERRIDFQAMNDSSQPSPDGKTAATWDQWLRGETEHAFLAFADRTSRAKPLRALAKLPKHLSRHFCWSPDGSHVHVSQRSAKVPGVVEHCIVDAKTQAVTPLDILRDHVVMDCSRDGKTFLTLKVAGDGAWAWKSLHLMNADGTEVRTIAVADRSCRGMALSPDGTRALSVIDGKLAVVDATKLRPPAFVAGAPAGDGVRVAAWSPDGRRIAYTTSPVPMEGLDPDEQESRLVVADPSGQNATVLRAVKGESFGYVFWR